eukprot:CCRYP_014106-RA/>CCRYP_014106-RA protein AED:0.45 eAED:0.44 QI:0/0/0/1/0/0/2/0/120
MILGFIQIVRNNFDGCTKREIERAIPACKAKGMMGSLSDDTFATMNAKLYDHQTMNAIFGPIRKALTLKTVRRRPEHMETEFVPILKDYYDLHKLVRLTADVMIAHGIPFFATLLRGIIG